MSATVEAEWVVVVQGEGTKAGCDHDWDGGTPAIRASRTHRQCLHCGQIERLEIQP